MNRRGLLYPAALLLIACALVPAAAAAPRQFAFKLGGTFVASGRTGSLAGHRGRATGEVVVHGRWNGGTWYVVTTTSTDKLGNYRISVTPRHRGTLLLRIVPPDKQERRYLLHVT